MSSLRTTHHPATADVAAAFAAYLCAGIGIAFLVVRDGGSGALALGAGAAVLAGACGSILRRTDPSCSPADRVTLARAVLAACCAVLTTAALLGGQPAGFPLVAVGTAAFVLDAVDGPVARRTGTASADGARLDTATDAALTLVLACAAAGRLGLWALLPGLLYYAFTAAGRLRPSLRRPLPGSAIRKAIGAFQPGALLFALLPGVPPATATAAALAALALLLFSFGRDVAALERLRTKDPSAAQAPLTPRG